MTLLPSRQHQLRLGLTALVIVGGSVAFLFYQLPALRDQRASIDTARANIQAIELQQQNLEILKAQQDQVSAAATLLGRDVWKFAKEDEFYSAIDQLAEKTNVAIDEPKVSDAIPNGSYQARSVTLTISGSTVNILAATRELMIIQPLISIKTVSLLGGTPSRITISGETVWQ